MGLLEPIQTSAEKPLHQHESSSQCPALRVQLRSVLRLVMDERGCGGCPDICRGLLQAAQPQLYWQHGFPCRWVNTSLLPHKMQLAVRSCLPCVRKGCVIPSFSSETLIQPCMKNLPSYLIPLRQLGGTRRLCCFLPHDMQLAVQ